MKKFLLFIAAVVGAVMALAESKVGVIYVVKTDGTEIELLVNELDYITLKEVEKIGNADTSIFLFNLNATNDGLIVSGLQYKSFGGLSLSLPK